MKSSGFTILLINPPTPSFMQNKEFVLPQGLLYLAGYLQNESINVELLDFNIHKPWLQSENNFDTYCLDLVKKKINSCNPNLIGFGCLFTGQFGFVLKFCIKIKTIFSNIPIVLGGMHPTIFAEDILKNCSFIDYIIIGEGEKQLLLLIKYLNEEIDDLSLIKNGIAFRQKQNIIIYPKTNYLSDLDALPLPAYNLIDFNKYKQDLSHWHNPKKLKIDLTIPIITSRSCPYSCNFCSMHLVGGKKFRKRTPENVVEEIALLYNKWEINHFNIMDDNFTFDKKRAIEICNLIIKKNINIQFETLNGLMMNTLDEEVIAAMVEAGWIRGILAIESGSNYIRNSIMKKHLPESKIYEVIEIISKYKHVFTKACFLIGIPEETSETLQETFNMMSSLKVNNLILTNVVPYPGTELYEQSLKDNLFLDEFDPKNVWNNINFYMINHEKFYIRTYTLSNQDLLSWRIKFNKLISLKNGKN
jgi:anaerobic magnesium-protoporphyrin IX monomethyl ester cyclase